MVSYWMAYLKANYPKYFISILTSSVIGSEKQTRNYIFEAFKLGVKVLKPSVNKSTSIFNPEGNDLRYPLLGIKNLGKNTVNALLEERENGEFKNYVDFISRTHTFLNKRVIESLIKAGALDEFNYTKKAMIDKLDEVINYTVLGGYIDSSEFLLEDKNEYAFEELESFEFSVLGLNLSMNPLNEHEEYILKHNLLKPSTIDEKSVGKEVRVVGVINFIRKIKTKNGKDMAFVTIMDGFSKIDGVLFTTIYNEVKDSIVKNEVYLFKAKVEERSGALQLVINRVHKL
jgi:DNA polymerase-3 subunit alpha